MVENKESQSHDGFPADPDRDAVYYYSDIVEIQEGARYLANWFLERGYTLLTIQQGARSQMYPRDASNHSQAYVHRQPVYVLGRTNATPHSDPPPPKPR